MATPTWSSSSGSALPAGAMHPCHGGDQRPILVIFAGQQATCVRPCPAVRSRHRNASHLILKNWHLILSSDVRNNALSWWSYGDSNPRPPPCHLGATRSMRVIDAGQRTLAVIHGRCRTVQLLHFAAALAFMESSPRLLDPQASSRTKSPAKIYRLAASVGAGECAGVRGRSRR